MGGDAADMSRDAEEIQDNGYNKKMQMVVKAVGEDGSRDTW